MVQRLIVLSGSICAGKSSLARALEREFDVEVISTRELISQRFSDGATDRAKLQAQGSNLDDSTNGQWIADELAKWLVRERADSQLVCVDAVRDERQIDALRAVYPTALVHLHLEADVDVRESRYAPRNETTPFDAASADRVEQNVHRLRDIADVCIDTNRRTPEDTLAIAAAVCRLVGPHHDRLVDVLVGGQWGSEGKGQVAAHLAPEYQVLVRVGGPNAGHSVYESDGADKFFHLPSGVNRSPDSTIVLGPGSVIYPSKLLREIQDHAVDLNRLRIDPQAMVIDDWDKQSETGLRATIGSTAQGVGFATARKLLRNQFPVPAPPVVLAGEHPDLKQYVESTSAVLSRAYRRRSRVFLEGTQGTLLSVHHGSYPYVTSRDTTVAGCLSEAGIAPGRLRRSIMVVRTYPIRVQSPHAYAEPAAAEPLAGNRDATSGPMGREIDWPTVAQRSGIPVDELVKTELSTTTQKLRRVAEFSWVDLALAAELNSPTDIALTFVDYLGKDNRQARRFDQLDASVREFCELVARTGGAPVSLLSVDFSHRAIIDRRQW